MRNLRKCLITLFLVCATVALFYRALRLTYPTDVTLEYSTKKSLHRALLPPTNVPSEYSSENSSHRNNYNKIDRIVLSTVVCGTQFNESLNIIKSVLIFTRTPVYFVIFADDYLTPMFKKQLELWKILRNGTFDFELHKIYFPAKYKDEWINLFKKCSAQRLFLPILLKHIDSMIYVDVDTLFLGPADQMWRLFSEFNSSQICALSIEDANPNTSWYPRFAKHPFYGKLGVNSGVMLMNLTRMRDFEWVSYLTPIMLKYKRYLTWGDQDIVNIIFHYHPEALHLLSCRHNYRTDQCVYGDTCGEASRDGVLVLHGSRGAFIKPKHHAFRAIYQAVDEHELGTDPRVTLLPHMKAYYDGAPASLCGSLRDAFLKMPQDTVDRLYGEPDR